MRDIWSEEREKRNASEGILPAFQSWHRICPMCAGEGGGMGYGFSRLDPPEWIDCHSCGGIGRVDQAHWQEAIDYLKSERLADEQMAQFYEREYEETCLEAIDG